MMLHELRDYRQLPIFISRECADLVRWARTLTEERSGPAGNIYRPFEFAWIEAAEIILGPEYDGGPLSSDDPRRARVDAVLWELRAANLHKDAGYFKHGIRMEMAQVIVAPESPCELEIVA